MKAPSKKHFPRVSKTKALRLVAMGPGPSSRLTPSQVKLAALEAYASFFHSISKKTQTKYFNLLPDILNILPPLKDSGDSEHLQAAFVALTELAEASSRMFKNLFNNLVKFSIGIIQDKELSDETRQQALELMSTFADCAPAMCKKDPSYTQDMVTQCLSLMTDVGIDDDDGSEWNASEDVRSLRRPIVPY
jgi:importin-5